MGLFNLGKNRFPVEGKVRALPLFHGLTTDAVQTVLLIGASEGMGLSVAKILAQKGANIVIVSRNVEKLESALQEIKVIDHLVYISRPILT
jgi:3-dehydrosphinganine reductase